MAKQVKCVGKVLSVERLNNSQAGNPRYSVLLDMHDIGEVSMTTKSDAQVGYRIDSCVGKVRFVTYHVTMKGNYILDGCGVLS